MTDVKTKAALKLADFGNLREAAKAGAGKRVHLATLIMAATGIIQRTGPTGDAFYGLKGSVEATYADGTVITADAVYLPPALLDDIRAKLEADDAPRSIEFAFDVGAVKATDGDHYNWDFGPKVKPRAGDPLAQLRSLVSAKKGMPCGQTWQSLVCQMERRGRS